MKTKDDSINWWKLTLTTPWPALMASTVTITVLALLILGILENTRPMPEVAIAVGALLSGWLWCANRLYHRNPICTKCGNDKTTCRHGAYP